MAKRKPRAPKLPAGITEEFLDEFARMSDDDMKQRILTMQNDLARADAFLKTKAEIVALKAELSLIEAPFRETMTVLKNRTKFIIDELRRKGILDDGGADDGREAGA
jgi:hypothetical protein